MFTKRLKFHYKEGRLSSLDENSISNIVKWMAENDPVEEFDLRAKIRTEAELANI